jgi:hypothetical protein
MAHDGLNRDQLAAVHRDEVAPGVDERIVAGLQRSDQRGDPPGDPALADATEIEACPAGSRICRRAGASFTSPLTATGRGELSWPAGPCSRHWPYPHAHRAAPTSGVNTPPVRRTHVAHASSSSNVSADTGVQ